MPRTPSTALPGTQTPRRSATPWLALVPLVLAVALAPGSTASAEIVLSLEQSFFPGEAHSLELDLSVGSLTVEGTDGRDVEVLARFECEREDRARCLDRAERLFLKPRVRRGILHIELKGTTRRRLQGIISHLTIRAPRNLALEIDIRSGEVVVSGMDSHLEIDSAAGDVDIVHRRDLVRSVDADVGVGQADLWVGDGRIEGRGFPRSLSWSGSGSAELNVDLGAGDITIRLD